MQAEEILEYYKDESPVPVVAVAEKLGIEVFGIDNDDDWSGSIIKDRDSYKIMVNKNHSANRNRFTIAHEIGHFLCHRDYLDSHKSIEDSVNIMHRKNGAYGDQQYMMEKEANRFAASLLMPREEFINQWNISQDLKKIAEYFFVSESAAKHRAAEFGLILY